MLPLVNYSVYICFRQCVAQKDGFSYLLQTDEYQTEVYLSNSFYEKTKKLNSLIFTKFISNVIKKTIPYIIY